MRLVMFDVDGTLVRDNSGIDNSCYVDAVKDIFGVQHVDTEWSHYSNVTDSGITSEIAEKNWWKKAEERDLRAVADLYLMKLKQQVEKDPQCFQSVAGASELVADLLSIDEVCVCVATGGWRDSALLKLEVAGISLGNVPLASSDDSRERLSIMLNGLRTCENVQAEKLREAGAIYIQPDFTNKEYIYSVVGVVRG